MTANSTAPLPMPDPKSPICLPDGSALSLSLDETQIAELHAKLDAAVRAMDEARDYLIELAGPVPGPVAAQIITGINFGTGHFRTCRDTLLRLQRRKNSNEHHQD